MKIALSGKGGVGKSTISAALALFMAQDGKRVIALDSDPDANLASSLGISHDEQKNIKTISQQIELIEERTGAKVGQYGQVFKLNPEVSDIADNYAYNYRGVSLLVLGAVKKGGGGCACPENTFIRALVTDLVLFKDDALVMDMEAGIEHLGRATSSGVDVMLCVVEPGQRSIDCAEAVYRMSREIGIKKVLFIANKVVSDADRDFIEKALEGKEIIAYLPFSPEVRNADRDGVSVTDCMDSETAEKYREIIRRIEE